MERDPNGLDPRKDMGAKLDHDKIPASVISEFGLALLEVAKVGQYGMRKYRRGSWSHVKDGELRYSDAFWRHVLKECMFPVDESDLMTQAHTLWNDLARLELKLRRLLLEKKKGLTRGKKDTTSLMK